MSGTVGFKLLNVVITPGIVQTLITTSYSVLFYLWQSTISHELELLQKVAELSNDLEFAKLALATIANSTGLDISNTSPFECANLTTPFECAETNITGVR